MNLLYFIRYDFKSKWTRWVIHHHIILNSAGNIINFPGNVQCALPGMRQQTFLEPLGRSPFNVFSIGEKNNFAFF